MTVGRYIEGLVLLAVAFVPVGMACHAWRRRLLPGWGGPMGRLADLVIAIAATTFLSEVLGAAGLFRLAAVVPVFACVGLAGWYSSRRLSPRPDRHAGSTSDGRPAAPVVGGWAKVAALAAVSVVTASWATRTIDSLHHGMTGTDTLWYHMPFAARFAQQGTIVPLHYVDSEAVTVFFPATSELFHGLGILFLGSDFLSPLLNMGWGALALFAAWCIGRPYGVAPVTLCGVAALLATPGLVATQPGDAYDDIVGLALLLSAAALLIAAAGSVPGHWTGQNIAALAAGVALGTKFTFIAPVAGLTIGVWVLARRGRRMAEGGSWLLFLAATGSFWYLRNLIVVGNPLPSLHVAVGPLSLPSPARATAVTTVAHFLLNGNAWSKYLLPGLRMSFGPVWWALLGLAAVGLIAGALVGPDRVPRMLGWVGLFAGAVFLVTPQYLTILGAPVYFVDNVRYSDPAIVYGLALLPLVPLLRAGRRWWGVLAAYLLILAATQLDGTIWPLTILSERFGFPVGGVDSLLGLLLGAFVFAAGLSFFALRYQRPRWRAPVGVVAGFGVALLAASLVLQQFYLRNRYTNSGSVTLAAHVSHARIAVAGDFAQLQYVFYGKDLTNYVQYVGEPEPHHGYARIASCSQWRRALDAGHFDYVVASTGLIASPRVLEDHPTPLTKWTATDPAATLVRRQAVPIRAQPVYIGYSLFKLNGPLDPATCAPSGDKNPS